MNADPRLGGLLLADKPAGITSRAVAARAFYALTQEYSQLRGRRRRGAEPGDMRYRIGHAGTLDPLATGLLILLLGRASRLSPYLLGMDKTYLATVRLGAATDTLDADGQITDTAPFPAGPSALADVLPQFTGPIMQVPPIYSAIKRDGQSLHIAARAGLEVAEPPARPVTIHRLVITGSRWDAPLPEVDLEVGCSSGTYIRSLVRDMSLAAGTVGHLSALRRTTVGPFLVSDAMPDVMEASGAELAGRVIPPVAALPQLPSVTLTADMAGAVRNGRQPLMEWFAGLEDSALVQLVTVDGAMNIGDLVAIAARGDDGVWRLDTVLPPVCAKDETSCA
jgi:tRNA pseudouridine55 synthase